MLSKTMVKFWKFLIGFPSKEWRILHSKLCVDCEYKDHSQKICSDFEYAVKPDRAWFYAADLLILGLRKLNF